ncbi:Beta-4C adrenergic receptor [Trichoplax sp. H2]|nr:Beta-4C adrenergic receptor [Trichoplax sp. H2]|eukprot:RDD37995.1 Beta-4C adrenergic receptor [Trichoplax sp. H2]
MNITINSSNITTGNTTTSPSSNRTAQYIGWVTIGICILVANLFVFLIIVCRRRLHNSSNIILCSMFLSGSAIALLYVFPGRVFTVWRRTSIFMCSSTPSFAFASLTCYNLHICGVSLDKSVAIMSPFRHRTISNSRNALILIALIWLISFVASFVPLFTYRPYSNQRCVYNPRVQEKIQQDSIFQIVLFVTLVIVPMISTIILYSIIFARINGDSSTLLKSKYRGQKKLMAKNFKVARQMIFMLGIFAVCWLPFFLMFIVQQFIYTLFTVELYNIFRYIAFVYPIINPILFAFFTSSIRAEILRLCHKTAARQDTVLYYESTVKSGLSTRGYSASAASIKDGPNHFPAKNSTYLKPPTNRYH